MASTSNATINVNVSPSPGFCIKSNLLQPGILHVISSYEPTRASVPVPQGRKVFVNIAWSKDVPPPLDGVEKVIEFATRSRQTDLKNETDAPISVFVSSGRLDTDKGTSMTRIFNNPEHSVPVLHLSLLLIICQRSLADSHHHPAGKPALVFDCIYHSSLKFHASKDPEFRSFLVELALRQIEFQNSFALSRTLGTPNIFSKGALEQREVAIPATLFPPGGQNPPSLDKFPTKKLIEEITSSTAATSRVDRPKDLPFPDRVHPTKDAVTPYYSSACETPTWTWKYEGDEIRVLIQVPKLTRATFPFATLDLEPRRLTLIIPDLYVLDVDLELSDAALAQAPSAASGDSPHKSGGNLMVERARNLDIDRARAEWHVKERYLVVVA
ncbi:hypothetical protein BC827DRAFT_1322316 [Russula dissimulans]|nr:hypothetical protein BC827DRAFT_1322316 [Russula dissimulans]